MEILSWIASKWTILVAILFFGIIVMLHEFGHFSFAKLFKVKVNEFSMGMGPKIFSRKKGDTTYSWRLLPIGGFVSMEGEDEQSDDERAFSNQACWKRIVIVVAGALVNILLGLIISGCVLAANSDELSATNYVNYFNVPVSADSKEVKQVKEFEGLRSGDKFKKIDGKNVFYYEDIYYLASRDFDGDGTFSAVVEREGKDVVIDSIKTTILQNLIIVGVETTPGTIFKDTFKQSFTICRMVYLSLFDMITGKYSIKDVSGPIGVVDVVSQTAEASKEAADYTALFRMMALITINIGLFNLLPLPALDGGRLFFLLIELILRKPVNPKYEAIVHGVGMAILLAFMVFICFKDIWVLVTGG